MNGLQMLAEPRAGLLDRVRGRKPKEHAAIALNNYVATTPLANITGPDVSRILTEHKCQREEIKPTLVVIYTQVLSHFAQDAHLSAQEQSDLAHLRTVFGLTAAETDALDRDVLLGVYQTAVRGFFADGHFTFREREQLEKLAHNFEQDEADTDALILDEAYRTFEQSLKRPAATAAPAAEQPDSTNK